MADSPGKVIPPAAPTQSLCPKLGSIMCHNEAEPRPGSPETEEAEPVFHYILFSGKLKICASLYFHFDRHLIPLLLILLLLIYFGSSLVPSGICSSFIYCFFLVSVSYHLESLFGCKFVSFLTMFVVQQSKH